MRGDIFFILDDCIGWIQGAGELFQERLWSTVQNTQIPQNMNTYSISSRREFLGWTQRVVFLTVFIMKPAKIKTKTSFNAHQTGGNRVWRLRSQRQRWVLGLARWESEIRMKWGQSYPAMKDEPTGRWIETSNCFFPIWVYNVGRMMVPMRLGMTVCWGTSTTYSSHVSFFRISSLNGLVCHRMAGCQRMNMLAGH